jgi:hypothetical protein
VFAANRREHLLATLSCDPDAVWTAVWRILTPEQIRMKFAHLKQRPRSTNPDHLIPRAPSPTNVPPLRISDRYARPAARAAESDAGHADGLAVSLARVGVGLDVDHDFYGLVSHTGGLGLRCRGCSSRILLPHSGRLTTSSATSRDVPSRVAHP